METKDAIYFFRPYHREYGYLSNFYLSIFKDDENHEFCCNEQYFMYQKALLFDPDNNRLMHLILNEKKPFVIKKYGRQVKNFDDNKWNEVKFDIMLQGLRYKFYQNNYLKHKLLNTNDKKLYESSPYDKIWGIGFEAEKAIQLDEKDYGENLLGKALMEVRKELKVKVYK